MKRSILAAALVAIALLAGAAPEAHGGTYKAIQCYERSGAGHHDASYDSSSERYRSSADCEGRGLGITHNPGASRTGSGRFGAWTHHRPGRHRDRPGRGARQRLQPELPRPAGPHRPRGRSPGAPRRRTRRPPHGRLGRRRRQLLLRAASTCLSRDDCGDGRDAYIYMRRIALTLRDLTAPTLQLGGTLLEPGSRRGDQMLEVERGRRRLGSPLRHGRAERRSRSSRATLDCSVKDGVAIRLRPCPGNADAQVRDRHDGRRLPPGPERAARLRRRLRARGNRQPHLRDAQRSGSTTPVRSPGTPGSVLRARFKGAGGRMTAPSNEPATVIGTLTDAGGQPVRAAEVCVATRIATTEGPPERVIATPTTGPRRPLPGPPPRRPEPRGPRRPLARRPRGHRALPRPPLKSGPTPGPQANPLPLERRQRPLRRPNPRPGPSNRRVAIQARGTGKWIRIDGGRTDRGGRWSGNYRFTNTTGTRKYAFRAVIRRQPGYPYNPGHSKTRHATVTG